MTVIVYVTVIPGFQPATLYENAAKTLNLIIPSEDGIQELPQDQ